MDKLYRIPQGGKLYPVDKHIYDAANQEINAVKYRARQRSECHATEKQAAMCEGDCVTCRCAGIPVVPEKSMALYQTMRMARRYSMDTQMIYRCIDMLADMQSMDPDGWCIGVWIMDGYDQSAIAKHLGIPLSTYRSRLVRIAKMLGGE